MDSIKPIDPNSHVSNPSGNLISFNKGEHKGNLFDWQVESSNIFIDAEVHLNFFNEFICLGSVSGEFMGELSYHFNVCCSWYSSLALPHRCRLARRWSSSSATATASTSTASSTPWVSTAENNIELVEDFGWGMSTGSSGLSSCTSASVRGRGLGLLGCLGGGSGCHLWGAGCLS